MPSILRSITAFAITALLLTTTAGGCSKIGAAIDCDQMCDELKTCIDGDLDTKHCSDRCEDKADTSSLRHKLDDCTDCLDNDYSCAEVPTKCMACQEVTDELL